MAPILGWSVDGLTSVRALRDATGTADRSRRIGHVRVDLRDAADRLVATGETTHAVMGRSRRRRPPDS
jgi:hypothetical protein